MQLLNLSDILMIKYCVIVGIGVRLVNGTAYNEGRIEIFHSNEWGSICDNTFDKEDGQVVCRMLGLDTTYVLFLLCVFGGVGPIVRRPNCPTIR